MSAADAPALHAARLAAIGVVLGAIVTPPLGNAAAALMLVAFFFIPDWRDRLRRSLASRLGRGVLVFFAALVFGAIVGAFNPQGAGAAFTQLLGWRTLLLMLLAFAVFDSERAKRQLAIVFIVLGSAAGIVSLVTLAADVGIRQLPPGMVLRNTVTQAMAFGIAAFLALILLVTWRSTAPWQRILLGAAASLLLGLLVFLQVGRSGQVMFVVLMLVAAVRVVHGTRRALAIVAVPALVAAAFVASPVMQSRFATGWQEVVNAATASEYSSMGIRVVMWHNAVELVRERPLLGYGLGGVEPAYAALVKDRATGWKATVTGDPHNQFLNVWVQAGLPGLLAFLFFLAMIAAQPGPEPWRSVALSLLAAWCATSMASSHFQTFNEGHLIAIFLGAFLAPVGPDAESHQAEASASATVAATSS